MKSLSYAFLAAAAACGMAAAETAYTTPVGYVTETLGANRFNLVGLTVHNTPVSAGVLDAVSPTSVTDTEVDFSATLTSGATYVLELPSGLIQEVVSWSGHVLTTPQNISGSVVAGTTTYKLRKAATVSSIFGATNSAGLTPSPDGSLEGVDKVLILNAGGTFDTVFYFNDGAGTQGWYDDAFNPAENKPIVYADSFFVQKAGAASSLTVLGEVKTKPTSGALVHGYNYVGGTSPTGLTVGGTGLQAFLTPSPDGDLTNADLLLIQQPSGVYTTCFYFNDGAGTVGWYDDAFNDASAIPVDNGVLILNKGSLKPFTMGVPASYSGL